MDKEKMNEMLEDCHAAVIVRNTPFNKWELDFLESVSEQYETEKWLSEKQQEILEKCWDKI